MTIPSVIPIVIASPHEVWNWDSKILYESDGKGIMSFFFCGCDNEAPIVRSYLIEGRN